MSPVAILDAIEHLREHGGAGKEIKGHRDGYSTECPGDQLYAWVKKGAHRPGGSQPTHPPSSVPAWPVPAAERRPGRPLHGLSFTKL